MAFCEVTEANVENLNLVVKVLIKDNPESLKNFRDFTQGVVQFLQGKGVPVEKAITLAKYIPDAINGFNLERENRDLLKKVGVSLDAIRDVEDQFDTYNGIAKFIGLSSQPTSIVIVNDNQLAEEAKVQNLIDNTKVTLEGDVRIINGKKYGTRVTNIAKVGFNDTDPEFTEKSLTNVALKHGNTVDAIAKNIFDNVDPKFSDYSDRVEQNAFDGLVSKLKTIKKSMDDQGFIFKTSVTTYNKELDISGEIDLLAINPEGQAYVLDFKTANQRFNETYLKTDTLTFKTDEAAHDIKILSKWQQYGTQGYIYGNMLSDQTGIKLVPMVGIIGINISYDQNIPYEESKIKKLVHITTPINIPFSDVRSEFRGKNMKEINEAYHNLKGKELGPITETKQRKIFKSGRRPRNLDRSAKIDEIAATSSQLQEEVDWFKSNPVGRSTLLNISDMVNTGLFGKWTLDGITIYKNASRGTVYHEGWHRFSQVFMTPEQRDSLYNSVKKDNIKFRTRDGRTINTSTASFLDVEEFLADEFAKYALAQKDSVSIQEGYTRLYRSEDSNKFDGPLPEWAADRPEIASQKEAEGRWFYKTLEEAEIHADKFGSLGITYIDVPTSEVEDFNARNNKFAGGYGKEGNEYFVTKEMSNKRKVFSKKSEYKYPTENKEPKNLFEKILAFLKRFFGINPRPVSIFQKLYTGKIADYIPNINNSYWNNLNSIATNSSGDEIVSNERFPLYVRTMDYLVGKQLRDAGKSFTAFKQSKRLQSQVLDNVFLALEAVQNDPNITDQQANELYNILDNQRDFTRAYLTATAYQTLKDFSISEDVFAMTTEELAVIEDLRDQYEDVEDVDAEKDDSKPERFDRSGNDDSAFSIADDAIQDMFRTVPKIKSVNSDGTYEYELNELGFPENHKFYDVFYKTKKLLSGAMNLQDMQDRMRDKSNQNIFAELSILSNFVGKFLESTEEKNFYRTVQNVQFVQAFYHAMSMPEVPNMQLTINYTTKNYKTFTPTMVSYRTASRSLTLKIIKIWEKNFKDRRNKIFADFKTWETDKKKIMDTPLYLTEDSKVLFNPFVDYAKKYPSSKEGIRSFWKDIGVTISEKAFTDKKSVDEMLKIKNILTSNIATYRNYIQPIYTETAKMTFSELSIPASDTSDLSAIVSAMPDIVFDDFAKEFFISNPISFFNEKKDYQVEFVRDRKNVTVDQSTVGMRFLFEDLAGIEEKFGERVSSGSFRIEDKTKYPYYIPNQLLIISELLNKLENTGEFGSNPYLQTLDPTKNQWMKRSYFMKRMFDNNGVRQKASDGTDVRIIVEDIASVRTVTEDGIVEKSPRSLTKDEKFFVDTLTLFKAGAIEIPRAETSSTMFSIRLSDYGNGKILPISLSEAIPKGGSTIPESFQSTVKDYFMAEIEKRQWFMNNDPEVKGANKIALSKQFNIFEGILPNALKKRVADNLDKTPEEIFALPELEAQFRVAITEYFENQIKEIRPRFDNPKTGLNKDQQEMIRDTLEAKGMSMQSAARLFVLNHFILSQEFYNIYYGDLYYYKNAFKRGKYVTNTGTSFYIDDLRNEMLNGIQNSTMHSIYNGTKPGGKDFRYINTSIIKDVEMRSSYVNNEDSKNMLLKGIIDARVAAGILTPRTPEYDKFVQDTKDSISKYYKVNIADGQGIISMDFYRNFSIMTNIWSEKKEKEYERQKAIFRNHYDLYFKLDESGNKVRMEGQELEDARAEDRELRSQKAFEYFNPYKISYTGPQAKDGPTRPVFDKFSVRPIIPEAVIGERPGEGKRDENLMLEMTKNDIDYVKFESGSKVYQDTSFDWYNKIRDGEYELNDFTTEEIEPNQLFAGYLKHQLSTEGFKEENIFGSQFRKIVFGIKYSPMVRDNRALYDKFSELEKRYKQTVDDLIKMEQNDLFSILGITESKGQYKVSDMKKFLKLLQEESLKRGVAINNIDYIQYNEVTKNAKYPIDYAFNRQQIQDLISGLMDERLRRLKLNGSSLIQVSSAGTENKSVKFKNPTEEDIKKYGTNGLHYYHIIYDENGNPIRTSTMGVKVAFSDDYEGLFNLNAPPSLGTSEIYKKFENEVIKKVTDASGRPVAVAGKIRTEGMSEEEALKRLNQALKDPEWRAQHIDKLRLIGYRIPTQNINFTDNMEIMEFLPRSAGAIIIAPPELIIKSGSDFDIDKMNIIRPAINKKGQLEMMPTIKVITKKGDLVRKKNKLYYTEGGVLENRVITADEIGKKISEQSITEYELRKKSKQLSGNLAGMNTDALELLSLQKKIRFTIINTVDELLGDQTGHILDIIVNNAERGERRLLPTDQQYQDLLTKDEIDEYKNKIERLTENMVLIDQRIELLKEGFDEINKEKASLDANDLLWFNKKKAYKKAKTNDLVFIFDELMSHPYYFELLVTPSSAAMFEDYTNLLIAAQQNMDQNQYVDALIDAQGNGLFDKPLSPWEASTYTASLDAFDNLLSKRKDLGGYAIQRTFADIFNFVNFSVAKSYSVKVGKDYETKILYTPLIAPEDRSKVLQNGRLLMHGDSVSGIPISRAFDELISLTVDLAGSPAYPHMGINNYNKKHVQYLLHQKTDAKQVLWFMNQPILKELFRLYEEKRRKIQGYTLKHAIVELSLKETIGALENPKAYKKGNKKKYEVLATIKIPAKYNQFGEIEEPSVRVKDPKKANQFLSRPYWDLHTQNLTDNDNFTFEDMDAAIRSGDINGPLQKKVLAYFASITEEADMLMKLQFSENVDTTKYATLTSLIRNENNRREIRDSDLFDNQQIDKIEKESMIAPFDYTKKAKEILKALFPKLYTDRTISAFSDLVTDVWGAKNSQIERISKIVENDYIEFVYKNYGTYNGQNLSEFFQDKLIDMDNTQDHEFFSYRLNAIKAKYPELLDIPFVSGLYEDVYFPPDKKIENSYKSLDNKEIHNVFFLRNPDNPTFEKNVFTNNWRNLINFDSERLGLKETYTSDNIQEISDFFHELVYFSLYQAGLTNTGNGFSDLIPYEYWASFIEQSFDAYDAAKEANKDLEAEMLEEFKYRLRQMNPKINWRTKNRVLDSIDPETGRNETVPIEFYKNYYRGKDYKVTDDDLILVRELFLRPDDEIEDNTDNINVSKPKGTAEFTIGRVVEFEGEKYILIKQFSPGIWQLFSPRKSGSTAKVAARESRLTALNEKGTLVQYGGKNYIVTSAGEIVDIDKAAVLNLLSTNINRKNIIDIANKNKEQIPPPQNQIGPEGQPPIDPC